MSSQSDYCGATWPDAPQLVCARPAGHRGGHSYSDLTETERITLITVRVLAGSSRRPVSTSVVIEHNWDDGRGSTYDQTNRALAGLVKKGYLTKPRRGVYEVAR